MTSAVMDRLKHQGESLKEKWGRIRHKEPVALLMRTVQKWSDDRASRMGAALAYYSIFSIGPLVFLTLTLAGFILGSSAASGQLYDQLNEFVGKEAAALIQSLVNDAGNKAGTDPEGSVPRNFAGLFSVGIITLLLASSAILLQMKDALNKVFEVEAPAGGVKAFFGKYLSAFAVIILVGISVLGLVVMSTAVSIVSAFFEQYIPIPAWGLRLIQISLSFALMSAIFVVLFRVLPDAKMPMKMVVKGALFTAVLFVVGKFLIGLYLGRQSFSSTYGAAGSFILLLVWIYYSSQLFFLGAEFVYAMCEHEREKKGEPTKRKMLVPETAEKA